MKKSNLFEPGRYAALPYTVMRLRGLSSGAKLVWQSLASHLGRDGSAVWPSVPRLAEMTGQDPSSVTRQIAELEGEPWRLVRVDRVAGRSSRYRLLQPQAGLFDPPPPAKCKYPQNASTRKMRPPAKCAPNYTNILCTDADTEESSKRTSCPKVGGNGDGTDRQAPGNLSSVSVSANGDGRRRGELLDLLAQAVRLQAGGLRTEARVRQFRVDCVALEGFLDLALNGRLGPVPQACDALLAKAENLGRSTVDNRMAALTAWVQKRQGLRKRKSK